MRVLAGNTPSYRTSEENSLQKCGQDVEVPMTVDQQQQEAIPPRGLEGSRGSPGGAAWQLWTDTATPRTEAGTVAEE